MEFINGRNMTGRSLSFKSLTRNPTIEFDEIILKRNEILLGIRFQDFDMDRIVYTVIIKGMRKDQSYSCKPNENGIGYATLGLEYCSDIINLEVVCGKISKKVVLDLHEIYQMKLQEQRLYQFLQKKYLQEKDAFDRKKSMQVYSALLLDVTPAIQKVIGYCRYDLDREESEEKILSVMNYYLGHNLTNILVNRRMVLSERGFEPMSGNQAGATVLQDNIDLKNLLVKDLLDEIENFERQSLAYKIYEASYQVLQLIARPINEIRSMVQRGTLVRDQLKEHQKLLIEAYHQNDFRFTFFEELPAGSPEANSFIKGLEFDIDYPALYREGQVYCSLDGSKK